ncbi:unnamed protein product [Camellia sinensis]
MLEREHKKNGVRIAISIEDILQASEMSIHDAANSLHVSISTLKRACRKLGIPRWPPRHMSKINKNGGNSVQISPTTGSLPRSEPLKNEGGMMQLDSLDQQSSDATKNGGDVICSQEKGTMKMPYREDKKTGVRIAMPSEHILQTSKESLEGAAEHHGGSPYVIQRWPTGMRRKNNEKHDSILVFQITRSLLRPGPLQNGDDQMMQLDSSDQQSMDAINITNVVGAEQSNIAVTCSQEKDTIKRSEREHKKTGVKIAIPIEDFLQASEMSLNDAAYRLNVSKPTLKHFCRVHGIEKWTPSTRTKFSCSQPFDEKQIQKLDSDLSSNQAWDIVTLTKPHDTATKDADIVTIMAKKRNNIVIKFRLSSSSGLVITSECWATIRSCCCWSQGGETGRNCNQKMTPMDQSLGDEFLNFNGGDGDDDDREGDEPEPKPPQTTRDPLREEPTVILDGNSDLDQKFRSALGNLCGGRHRPLLLQVWTKAPNDALCQHWEACRRTECRLHDIPLYLPVREQGCYEEKCVGMLEIASNTIETCLQFVKEARVYDLFQKEVCSMYQLKDVRFPPMILWITLSNLRLKGSI